MLPNCARNSAATASWSSNFAKRSEGVKSARRRGKPSAARSAAAATAANTRRGRVVTKRASHSMSEVIRRGVQEEGGR